MQDVKKIDSYVIRYHRSTIKILIQISYAEGGLNQNLGPAVCSLKCSSTALDIKSSQIRLGYEGPFQLTNTSSERYDIFKLQRPSGPYKFITEPTLSTVAS
jgi:hypothetical protein